MQIERLTAAGVLFHLRQVTEEACIACHKWIGKGQQETGDGAAVDAMRLAIDSMPFGVRIMIGEGEKDNAPQLYTGEALGDKQSKLQFDAAVDPVEGTSYMAKGLHDALAVIALADFDSMMDTGSSYYMEKIAVGPEVKGLLKPQDSLAKKLDIIAQAKNKNKEDLTVYMLERPRHNKLISELYEHGVKVLLYPAGDIAGALLAAMPDSEVDILLGTGGTPEAILSAVALKAMGGDFFVRFDPQLEQEKAAIEKEKFNTVDWYNINQLVQSDNVFFCATGLTDGLLLPGVIQLDEHSYETHSMLVSNFQSSISYFSTTHNKHHNNKHA